MQTLFADSNGTSALPCWRRQLGVVFLALSISVWLYAVVIALASGQADSALRYLVLAATVTDIRDSLAGRERWPWIRAGVLSVAVVVGVLAIAKGHAVFGWACIGTGAIAAMILVFTKRQRRPDSVPGLE
jgi:hypothetical protein